MTGPQLAGLGMAAATLGLSGLVLTATDTDPLRWYEISWPRNVEHDQVLGFLRSLAADRRRHLVALEAVGRQGTVRYRLGLTSPHDREVVAALRSFVPGAHAELITHSIEPAPTDAWRLQLSTSHRPLGVDQVEAAMRSVVTALALAGTHETMTVQWLLGPRLSPRSVHGASIPAPIDTLRQAGQAAWHGTRELDAEGRRALRDKVGQPGFRAIGRIGIASGSPERRRALAGRLLAALRVAESPGVRLTVKPCDPRALAEARPPGRWPSAVNISELLLLSGWPIGIEALPGVVKNRARLLPPHRSLPTAGRVIGDGTYHGEFRPVALVATDALQHLHVLGPTGVGKSTLLLTSAVQEIDAGRAVVVIDPKGDLIDQILERVPEHRLDDVVVLDPADASMPVGLNPLAANGQSAELVADQVLAVFHGLYREHWGPRTQDILHACLLTLAGRDGTTLCSLPMLLSNETFRRRVTATVSDEVALKPFWAWFEALTAAEREQAIAPVMNKLRAFLLRPRMRAVIGQPEPRFAMTDLFTKRRILLVSLAKGQLGPEAAALLGSLVVSQLWQATQARVSIAPERRHPVMVFIDEFQDYLHLPTDLADVLAQARGLGVGLTLAHQHLAQLSPAMRSAVLANARSRVCFQLSAEDAGVVARMSSELDPQDLQQLDRFQAYASLVARGSVTPYTSIVTRDGGPALRSAELARARSRAAYGQPLAEVEAALAGLLHPDDRSTDQAVGRRRRS